MLAALGAATLSAQFVAPASGVWQAHANPQLDDAIGIVPSANLATQCVDAQTGSGLSLGASSDGTIAVAVFKNAQPFAKAYDASVSNGGACNVIWTSSDFDSNIFSSAPLIGTIAGNAHATVLCDDVLCEALKQDGSKIWQTCLFSGTAPGSCVCADAVHTGGSCTGNVVMTSPTYLQDSDTTDEFVLSSNGSNNNPGPVFIINISTGAERSKTYIDQVGGAGTNSYVTNNSVCASGNTFYEVTNLSGSSTTGRMYSISVVNGALSINWHAGSSGAASNFNGPSGGSPLCLPSLSTVISDGRDATDTAPVFSDIYGWNMSTGALVFTCSHGLTCPDLNGTISVNAALDGRGGFWTFATNTGGLVRKSTSTGVTLQTLSTTSAITGEVCNTVPSSAIGISTLAGGDAAVIVGLQTNPSCNGGLGGGSYLSVWDVTAGTLAGYWTISTNVGNAPGLSAGQFPVLLNSASQTRIALTTTTGGFYMIGPSPTGMWFK